jgi:hypothetical protein
MLGRAKLLQRVLPIAAMQPCKTVWNESIDRKEALKAESFYDSTVEKVWIGCQHQLVQEGPALH